jgi:hypothetical protein
MSGRAVWGRRATFAVLLVFGGGLAGLTMPGPAGAEGVFTAVAGADGVRTTVATKGFLLAERFVDGAAPTAQAYIDSIGNSTAFAAYPYPGETPLSLAGIIADPGRTYPLMVSSRDGNPDPEPVDAGYYSLKATSTATSSSATATAGSGGDQGSTGLTRSKADVVVEDEIIATGESTSEAMSFGTVLRVGRVYAQARVVLHGEDAALSSQFHADGVSILGQAVGFDDHGLVLPGTTQPIDPNLASALSASGVSVHYLAPSIDDDKHGIVSAGMEVTVTHEVTGPGQPSSVTYTFGRATARAVASASGSAPAGGRGTSGSQTNPSPGVGTGGSGSSTPASISGSTAAPTPAAAPTTPTRGGAGTVAATAAPGFSTFSFYVVLVVAAAAMIGAAQLIRILGVRLTWIS